ncbi:MAG: carbohydrate ABC transporter permease [Lachnospiraceae bacterium]|nr:carbohydrate ABC transporter permease [Lachnospiraceae bacterium]
MGKLFIYILLFALAAIICFPVVFMFAGALMQEWELTEYLGPVLGNAEGMASWSLLPRAPTLAPVVELLLDSPQYFVMFWNSMKLSLCILAGQLLFGMPSAWALARYSFPGRKFLLLFYIVLMLMPFQVLMLPEYLVLNRLGLIDTHLAVILPSAFSTFPVFIMYRFFRGIPATLLEAAQIDGAGELQVFVRIGVPLGSAGVVSAAILGFLESWNMIEQPMTFLKTESLWPLSLFLPDIGIAEAGMGFAAAVFMLVPALLVFLCGQDYLEQGIAAAALKE